VRANHAEPISEYSSTGVRFRPSKQAPSQAHRHWLARNGDPAPWRKFIGSAADLQFALLAKQRAEKPHDTVRLGLAGLRRPARRGGGKLHHGVADGYGEKGWAAAAASSRLSSP
jgi:hypothetical protein